MSTDDKRTNDKFDDGLEELMNAFVGYDEKNKDNDILMDLKDEDATDGEKTELTVDPFADLTLNEIPYEEVQLPEIERANVYEYEEYEDFDGFDDFEEEAEEAETVIEIKPEEPKKTKKEK
ncbi:MAG: hypothetical protein IJ386_04440, partial [Clostridia bacterium]|nr:hypothetical protein [Clostridia bacterium]